MPGRTCAGSAPSSPRSCACKPPHPPKTIPPQHRHARTHARTHARPQGPPPGHGAAKRRAEEGYRRTGREERPLQLRGFRLRERASTHACARACARARARACGWESWRSRRRTSGGVDTTTAATTTSFSAEGTSFSAQRVAVQGTVGGATECPCK
jgi:hypothetical protein